ncbi:MAG TPA: hypothetical protein VH138_08620 [Vicinamibacterales bacterium]|jgi:hypothetical protein|nr:hypothetical protein [Vicinamibacterales bacterium]
MGKPRKDAFTVLLAVTSTVQVLPFTESHPVHPMKTEPSDGVAVRVTVVLITKVPEQLVPQLTPAGLDVTVPLPIPLLVVVNVKRCSMKIAVTDLALLIVTVHVAPDTESHPVQPAKTESLARAAAVSTT